MRLAAVALLTLAFNAAAADKEAAKPAPPPLPKPGPITAPAGEYKMDPSHASLTFKVLHFGLSNYTARFTKFDVTINLDPKKLGASSVAVTIDPTSVETDYPGDYKAGHPDSPYQSFDEAIAQGPKFFNASQYPAITFKSTKVVPQGKAGLRVTGDLTFLGQTHPVTLDVTVVGSIKEHPFTKKGAVGFSATGKLDRSRWGFTGMTPFVGDTVTLQFEGEFESTAAPEPAKPAG